MKVTLGKLRQMIREELEFYDEDEEVFAGEFEENFFHVKKDFLGEELLLTPRLPSSPITDDTGIVLEDMHTPRISFSTSIEGAIQAVQDQFGTSELFVYATDKLPGMIELNQEAPQDFNRDFDAVRFLKSKGFESPFPDDFTQTFDWSLQPEINRFFHFCVPDANETGEIWATKPVSVTIVGLSSEGRLRRFIPGKSPKFW